MNSEQPRPPPRTLRGMVLGGTLLVLALAGAFIVRLLPPTRQPSPHGQPRPIVQFVRQQPGLPDIADLIDRLCPSVAIIVARGSEGPLNANTPTTSAFEFSSNGWLVTSAADLPGGPLDAVFGDGHEVELSDVRTDPVSKLAIVKATDATAPPLSFSDQAFPRVGQFGFGLTTPAGTGCSADTAMIGSDFLADGGGLAGYVRLRPPPDGWAGGMPLLSSDGHALGIGTDDPTGAVIPAPIASVILDELIRDRLASSTSFGFRAIDYGAPLSTRLGDVRAGAGVALVQPKSAAARAGLQAGDFVTEVDGEPVSSASELNRRLDALSSKATLTVQRRSQALQLTIRRTPG